MGTMQNPTMNILNNNCITNRREASPKKLNTINKQLSFGNPNVLKSEMPDSLINLNDSNNNNFKNNST